MLPSAELLTIPDPASPILPDGRPEPELRSELRRIPSARNVATVAFLYAQTFAVIALACWWGHPIGYVLAFLWMGRTQAQFASLMHEAAHRLLFRHRALNDFAGRWLLGYPVFVPTDVYRRVHMAHHRQEFGPDEPDIPLYRGYPIAKASFRRKLLRDAAGITGIKLMRPLLLAAFSKDGRARRTVWSILLVQAVILSACWLAGYPLVYPLLWVLPHLTIWRVINRLRAIAEHGGMQASPDRRLTTHSVVQHPAARFVLVPYNIGRHLAHHCDAGIPWRNLPRYHEALRASGYVPAGIEYRSYPALWRALASG